MSEKPKLPTDLVSLYRCMACGRWKIVEHGNHHPWCGPCAYDIFDWSHGYDNITREEAERIMREDE